MQNVKLNSILKKLGGKSLSRQSEISSLVLRGGAEQHLFPFYLGITKGGEKCPCEQEPVWPPVTSRVGIGSSRSRNSSKKNKTLSLVSKQHFCAMDFSLVASPVKWMKLSQERFPDPWAPVLADEADVGFLPGAASLPSRTHCPGSTRFIHPNAMIFILFSGWHHFHPRARRLH